MDSAPVVVHRGRPSGGRQVTLHRDGREEVLGVAHSDHELIALLEAAGVVEPDNVLDDPQLVEWRDGPAHDWRAA